MCIHKKNIYRFCMWQDDDDHHRKHTHITTVRLKKPVLYSTFVLWLYFPLYLLRWWWWWWYAVPSSMCTMCMRVHVWIRCCLMDLMDQRDNSWTNRRRIYLKRKFGGLGEREKKKDRHQKQTLKRHNETESEYLLFQMVFMVVSTSLDFFPLPHPMIHGTSLFNFIHF